MVHPAFYFGKTNDWNRNCMGVQPLVALTWAADAASVGL